MSRSARHVLKHQYDLCLRFNRFVKLGNVRMVESLHKSDLPSDRLLPLDLLDLLFLVDLQGYFLVQLLVDADVDDRVGSLPYFFADDILVHGVLVRKHNFLRQFLWLGLLFSLFALFVSTGGYFVLCCYFN